MNGTGRWRAERQSGGTGFQVTRWLMLLLLAGCAPALQTDGIVLGLSSEVTPEMQEAQKEILFQSGEEELTARLHWPHAKDGVVVQWLWREPDGTSAAREFRRMYTTTDQACLRFAGTARELKEGRWVVQATVGNKVLAEAEFYLVKDKDRWWAASAQDATWRVAALTRLCARNDFVYLAGGYGNAKTDQEQQLLVECLSAHAPEAAPAIQEELQKSPTDETVLVLAYRVKKKLVEDLVLQPKPDRERLNSLAIMLTRWDAPLLGRLLESSVPEVRLAGVDLLGRSGSPERVFFLGEALLDPESEVRIAAIEALAAIGDVPSRETLENRLVVEKVDRVADRIRQSLAKMQGDRP